jgi:hypothetical protein
VTLVKPHYEVTAEERGQLDRGALEPTVAEAIVRRVAEGMPALGAATIAIVESPLVGGKSQRKDGRGNREWLLLVRPLGARAPTSVAMG